MTQLFTNNASGTLSVQAETGHTTLTLQSSEGSLYPSPTGSDFFQVSLEDTSGNLEICTCTSRSTDVLTVTRAQENTSALVFPTGSRVELRLTAATHDSFLQVYGGVMQGTLDMNNETLQDPLLTGGEIRNAPIRGTDGGTSNQIIVPTAGGDPTLGGNTIVHTGNDSAYALTTITFTGGEGIGTIGDLSANRTVDLAIDPLVVMNGNALLAADKALVWDDSSNSHKTITYDKAGLPIITNSSTNAVPTSAQVNAYWICTNAATVNFDIDTGVGVPGNVILIQQGGAGVVDFTGGTATVNSPHTNDLTNAQYSVAVLFCTATDVWTLYGDLN